MSLGPDDAPAATRPAPACPCGSGSPLSRCCGPVLADPGRAATAERLMRSRFSAYTLGDTEHLLATWHPRTRPDREDLAGSLSAGLTWTRLVIHDVEGGGPGDAAGRVEFTALARDRDGAKVRMREDSRFVAEGGRWLYVDGTPIP